MSHKLQMIGESWVGRCMRVFINVCVGVWVCTHALCVSIHVCLCGCIDSLFVRALVVHKYVCSWSVPAFAPMQVCASKAMCVHLCVRACVRLLV